MMLFILATEYNERGWREAANDGVLTNLTAWEYTGQKKQFSGAIYKTVGGAGAVCLMTILIEEGWRNPVISAGENGINLGIFAFYVNFLF